MSKQQLIEFMIRKGNERKRDQCEAAQVLTRDAKDHIAPVVQALAARLPAKQAKLDKLNEQRKNIDLEISGNEVGIKAVRDQMDHRKQMKNKFEAEMKKQRDELRQLQKVITPKLVKELYSVLETKNIPNLNRMIEAMVGLLRNSKTVSPSDVRIYLQKYEGLMFKMTNIGKEVSKEVYEFHSRTL